MDPFARGDQKAAGGLLTTSGWIKRENLRDLLLSAPTNDIPLRRFEPGALYLGITEDDQKIPVGWKDDKHLVTIAGSRAGKGRSAIMPNLMLYTGSVFCLDPKGENAKETAVHRAKPKSQGGLGQEVFVLDPYDVSGVREEFKASFNPLWMVELGGKEVIEHCSVLADSMVIATDPKDAHWDDSARNLIEALIIHVRTAPEFKGKGTLTTVRALLAGGLRATIKPEAQGITFPAEFDEADDEPDPFQHLFQSMTENDSYGGVVAGQGYNMLSMSDAERGSVLSTAQRHTKFLDGVNMTDVLRKTDHNLNMKKFRSAKNGISVYMCLPARYMASHSRWFRLILNSFVIQMERQPLHRTETPALTILDEFPILGPMKTLETSIGYMAGFGMKIWTILQDINQLKRDYPHSWETFLGNAGIIQYFGNSDRSTLEFISRSLGEVEVAPEIVSVSTGEAKQQQKLSDADISDKLSKQTKTNQMLSSNADYTSHGSSTSSQTTTQQQLMKTALMTPDEVARAFSKYTGRQLLITPDVKPFYLIRTLHTENKDWSVVTKTVPGRRSR